MSMPPEIDPQRLGRLVRDMVDIYSPSGKETELTEFLAGYLHDRGLPVMLREVSEGRRNIEVVFPGPPPELAFMGHIDTVPAFDIEQAGCREENGVLHGLGTADMKAGCAAMIEAFLVMCEHGRPPLRAGLFLVVGEEESGDGTAAMLRARSFPWAIVAEPTELTPCLAHYGYIEMLVRVFGTRRHASLAGRQYNAIQGMLRTLLRLGKWLETEHPEAILNIRDLHSSESGFAVPGRCEAGIDVHLPPDADPGGFAAMMAGEVETSLASGSVTDYKVEFPIQARGYRIADAGWLPRLLAAVFKRQGKAWRPGAFQSHSDANLLRESGCHPIILGPGQLAKAHTRDESIALDEVRAAASLYRDVLDRMHECAADAPSGADA